MLADIEDRDRYCKQKDEDVFVVKLCAIVCAIEHLLIVATNQRLRQTLNSKSHIRTLRSLALLQCRRTEREPGAEFFIVRKLNGH
jgi:hypothetical protein